MEMVAASKMRKSQEIALASRPYAFAVLDLLATMSKLNEKLPELFEKRKIKAVLFVLVSSDKGLAGAFNSSVFRKFEQHMKRDKEKYANEEKFFVAVGEKSFNYLSKRGLNIVNKFIEVGDYVEPEQVHPLADFLAKGYLEKKWDRVIIFSTHFRSALKQETHVRRILPIDFDHIKETVQEIIPERGKFADLMKEHEIDFVPDNSKSEQYSVEPEPEEVLGKLAEHLFFVQVYHLILEANASEHSARRMAMKTASDNASDLGDALNMQYNKSRQSKITTEISEISAGAEALS
jgi:F-type H+-transporting ATPase subunit gamma